MPHGKSPDFRLCCRGQEIGIEITEAASTNHLDYMKASESAEGEILIEPSCFSASMERLTSVSIESLLTNELDDGHVGSAAKEESIKFIGNAIAKKLDRLAQSEFHKFEQNWLLIYQNTPYDLFLKKENLILGIEKLWPACAAPYFNRIFVESVDPSKNESFITALSGDGVMCFPVKDVWEKAA